MLDQIELINFGPLVQVKWDNLGSINLIIGGNGVGKTFLMKARYCAIRTLEEYKRNDDTKTTAEILVEKLKWTFETGKIGDLVTKGVESPLLSRVRFDGKDFQYSFGKDTTKQIQSLKNHVPLRDNSNSIFLPAKEVLSLYQVILCSHGRDQLFGFDDTYPDLVQALGDVPNRGKNYAAFCQDTKDIGGYAWRQGGPRSRNRSLAFQARESEVPYLDDCRRHQEDSYTGQAAG